MPKRKVECANCGNPVYVRTRPSDKKQVLVTKEQTDKIEEQWSIVNGTHQEYLAEKNRFAKEKERLTAKFAAGKPASDSDVEWSLLNKDSIKHAQEGNWGLYRNTRFAMAEFFKRRLKLKEALAFYFEVCYLDLNGPNNTGGR